jgi:aminomuconate-semialdehyde/2-hydroxymuconate-6-semialdehyde dehydrogenase
MNQYLNFIGGHFVPAVDGSFFPHLQPSTGQAEGDIADSDLLDVVKAVQAANQARADWLRKTGIERAAILTRVADLLESKTHELALLQSRDQGTPFTYSRDLSLPRAIAYFRFHASKLLEAPTRTHLPVGLIAAITPWSDPIAQLASRTAPALAAGNTIVAKASEFAPASAQAFAKILNDAGLPAGVFNLVQGRGAKAGAAVANHPGLSTISFTGRTETGQKIVSIGAESMKRVHTALSAQNAVVIFPTTEVEKRAQMAAEICVISKPQICLRGARVFVQDALYKDFLEAFKLAVDRLKQGPAELESTQIGPLANLELKEKFNQARALAISEKGKVLCGVEQGDSSDSSGYFVRPTVIYDLNFCSTLQQQEIVGPFVTISSFKYLNDAVKSANNSPMARAAYVFEDDPEKAVRVAQKIESSQIFCNQTAQALDAELEFTQLKSSGFGDENGLALSRFFSRPTVVLKN